GKRAGGSRRRVYPPPWADLVAWRGARSRSYYCRPHYPATDSAVLARTSRRMTAEGTAFPASRVARLAAWLALPLVALGILRLFPPLALPAGSADLASWLTTAISAVLALAGLTAALLALGRGFRSDGQLRDLLEGAGLGA